MNPIWLVDQPEESRIQFERGLVEAEELGNESYLNPFAAFSIRSSASSILLYAVA